MMFMTARAVRVTFDPLLVFKEAGEIPNIS